MVDDYAIIYDCESFPFLQDKRLKIHTQREEIKTLCDIFKAQIVDITPELYILQYVDTSFEVDRFLKAVKEQAEVVETVRSGVCGIFRGEQSLHS